MSDEELYRVYIVTYARVKSGGAVNLTDWMVAGDTLKSPRAQVAVAVAADHAAGTIGLCCKRDVLEQIEQLLV